MTARILGEAKEKALQLTKEAEQEAAKIRREAGEENAGILAKAKEKADAEAAKTRQRYASLADTRKKQAYLNAKQEMIAECIGKAKEKVLSLSDGDYFAMIRKLLSANLAKKDGVLKFSEKDLRRLPAGFATEAAAMAEKAGGTLTVSEEPAPIDGGFVLAYGGIEENCSVSALFEEKADELVDAVSKLLFT